MEQTFRFRLSDEEDRLLRYLARRWRRSRSDAVRLAIRRAAYDALVAELSARNPEDWRIMEEATAELNASPAGAAIPGNGGGR